MFPAYRGMNSYPYQSPSAQFHYPSWESFPQQMMENRGNSLHMNEPWPHNHGDPSPMPCYNCCTHGLHPAYYSYRPPCSHFPPPSTHGHCCSSYPPAYPHPYPYVPPPNYTMELPRYEYDKNATSKVHYCGCPNHLCLVKDKSNVKIEEHEPEVETQKTESLVPGGVNNSPYPFLWIPPGYIINKEQPQGVVENDSDGQQVAPFSRNRHAVPKQHQAEVREHRSGPDIKKLNQGAQAVEQDPHGRYQWFPLDMNSIKQLIEGNNVMKSLDHGHGGGVKAPDQENKSGDKKVAHDLEKKDQNKQLSYPIIWVPYDGQGKDRAWNKEERKNGESRDVEQPSGVKILPLQQRQSVEDSENSRAVARDHDNRPASSKKDGNVKTIPVRQLDDSTPKYPKQRDCKQDGIPMREEVKQVYEEPAKYSAKMQSSSPRNKSKLPPICLKVDPPKKKNGSSRSPSPPGDKKRQEVEGSKAEGKDKGSRSGQKEIKVQDVAEKEPKGNKIKVSYGTSKEEKGSSTQEHKGEAEKILVQETEDTRSSDTKGRDVSSHPEPQAVKESKHEKPSKLVRKVQSVTEAAVIIQSAYRGFELRRREPLKKLRQIANISDEASVVKRQIEELESHGIVDSKEKVVVGEAIMKLLLELDTIQGVHSSIRDGRRSVAKELTILQEKLDSVKSGKAVSNGSNAAEVLQEHANVSDLDEGSSGSSEIVGDAVNISSQSETSVTDKVTEPEKVDEGVNLNGTPESEHLGVDNVLCSPEDAMCTIEPETEPKSQVPISALETAADFEKAGLCLNKKEECNESEIISEDIFIMSHEPLAEMRSVGDTEVCFDSVSSNENQASEELPEEVDEKVEDEISRMNWECDLGTAKMNGSEGEGQEEVLPLDLPQEIVEEHSMDEISRMDWECDLGAAKISSPCREPNPTSMMVGQDQGVLAESHEVNEEEKGNILAVASSGTSIKDQEVNQAIEHHVPTEVLPEETHNGQEAGSSDGVKCVEMPALMQDDHMPQEPEVQETSAGDTRTHPDELVEVIAEENEALVRDLGTRAIDSNKATEFHENLANSRGHACEALAEHCNSDAKAAPELLNLQETNDNKIVEQQLNGMDTVEEEHSVGMETSQSYVKPQKDEAAVILPPESQGSLTASVNNEQIDKRVIQENEKLREMLEKLLASGKENQDVIYSLTAKVKDLEKKLAKEKKMKSAKGRRARVSRPSCWKSANGSLRQRTAMVV